jgi:hypothetical protein
MVIRPLDENSPNLVTLRDELCRLWEMLTLSFTPRVNCLGLFARMEW